MDAAIDQGQGYSAPVPVAIMPMAEEANSSFARIIRISNSPLSPAALQFIDEKLIKNQYQVSIAEVIQFLASYEEEVANRGIEIKNLANYCGVNYRSVLAWFYESRALQRESQQALSIAAQQWLNQLQFVGAKISDNLATLYMANISKIRELKINVTQFARHFEMKSVTLKRALTKYHRVQKKKTSQSVAVPLRQHRPVKSLTAEEIQWFTPLQSKGEFSCREIASCCLPHLAKIKHKGVLRRIACHFNISPENFRWTLYLLRRNQKELAQVLTAEARAWLDQLLGKQPLSRASVAKLYMRHLAQMEQLGINRSLLALYTGTDFIMLNRSIECQRGIARRKEKSACHSQVKSEPLSQPDAGAELWFRSQLFRNLPTLLHPDDVEIVLGHAQGPVREMLAEIDPATLCITQSTEFLALMQEPALYAAATQRLAVLREAASNGELQRLIHEEGYYKLLIDEQHPELGMGLYASRFIPRGFVLGIYPGVIYSSRQQFQHAARNTDGNFPVFAFECRSRRPRGKAGAARKKPREVHSAVGGHLQTAPLVYANTGAFTIDGRVKDSPDNNLAAVMAGKSIIAYVAIRDIAAGEPLLIHYGDKYRLAAPAPVKQEAIDAELQPPQEKLCAD